jgi:hypothetical protein
VPDGFEWVLPCDQADWEVFRSLNGSSRLDSWRPVRVKLGPAEDGVEFRPAALPWMGSHVLVLKREAVEALGPTLSGAGELLPLDCEEAELHVFNALNSLGALDEERSDLVRFSSGRIMQIKHNVVDPDTIGSAEVFKLTAMPRGSL